MAKKENPLSVYAVVSQLSFTVLSPLLLFIVGGYFATDYFGWESWAMGICVALGIIFMICATVTYLKQLIRRYGKENTAAPRSFNDTQDNDYYDDN